LNVSHLIDRLSDEDALLHASLLRRLTGGRTVAVRAPQA
jgi:hypothetical protein